MDDLTEVDRHAGLVHEQCGGQMIVCDRESTGLCLF